MQRYFSKMKHGLKLIYQTKSYKGKHKYSSKNGLKGQHINKKSLNSNFMIALDSHIIIRIVPIIAIILIISFKRNKQPFGNY